MSLIDCGADVSLPKLSSLATYIDKLGKAMKIHVIMDIEINIAGTVTITLKDCSDNKETKFYVVNQFSRDVDLILGQECFAENKIDLAHLSQFSGYQVQIQPLKK